MGAAVPSAQVRLSAASSLGPVLKAACVRYPLTMIRILELAISKAAALPAGAGTAWAGAKSRSMSASGPSRLFAAQGVRCDLGQLRAEHCRFTRKWLGTAGELLSRRTDILGLELTP